MEQISLCTHIGNRIKLYRKNKKMTARQLAATIHKSTSAVSKYENGEVAIDIITLSEIAAALDVHIMQLIDIPSDPKIQISSAPAFQRGFFSRDIYYYTYFISGKNHTILRNLLEIHHDDLSVVFYNRLEDFSNKYSCRHLYHGSISVSDTYVHFVMENQVNNAEKLYLVVFNPLHRLDVAYGILSGISSRNMMPVSFKTALSPHPLDEDEDLSDQLIFTKEELRNIRITNSFSLDLCRE